MYRITFGWFPVFLARHSVLVVWKICEVKNPLLCTFLYGNEILSGCPFMMVRGEEERCKRDRFVDLCDLCMPVQSLEQDLPKYDMLEEGAISPCSLRSHSVPNQEHVAWSYTSHRETVRV